MPNRHIRIELQQTWEFKRSITNGFRGTSSSVHLNAEHMRTRCTDCGEYVKMECVGMHTPASVGRFSSPLPPTCCSTCKTFCLPHNDQDHNPPISHHGLAVVTSVKFHCVVLEPRG
ncbi:hypothetical protein CDAR_232681 [Caerostris darwini]|uniref:Uncharacterized protein n=1 Tax=Caerostris darwini TaxID=1538125 RepID=A0AAV4TLU0_9ARAC|nr:hypothetical protein CDAR_232681 [Caerostris darwini]